MRTLVGNVAARPSLLTAFVVGCLLLVGASNADGQGVIAGRVTDARSGLPLGGATVQVEALRLGAVAAADGRYRIANVIFAVNPERVVIGGGMAEAGELILDPARDEVRRRVVVPPAGMTRIVRAELGYEAGSIGAALWGAETA